MKPSSKRQTWEETRWLLQKKLSKKLLPLLHQTTTTTTKKKTSVNTTNELLTPSKPSSSNTKQQISLGDTHTETNTTNLTTPETSNKMLLTPMTKVRDPKKRKTTPLSIVSKNKNNNTKRGIDRPSSGVYSQTESRTIEYDKLVRFASDFPGPNYYQKIQLQPISLSPSSSSSLRGRFKKTKSRLTKDSQKEPGPVLPHMCWASKSFNRGFNTRSVEERMDVNRMNGFGGMGMCGKDNGIPSGTLLIMNEVGKTFNVKDTSWL